MFGLGFGEIIIICLAIIIFIRPEDVPKFAKKAGKLYGDLKRFYHDFFLQFRKIEQEIKKPLSTIMPNEEKKHSTNLSQEPDK